MATHEIKRGLKFYLDGGLDKHDLTRVITRVNEKKDEVTVRVWSGGRSQYSEMKTDIETVKDWITSGKYYISHTDRFS